MFRGTAPAASFGVDVQHSQARAFANIRIHGLGSDTDPEVQLIWTLRKTRESTLTLVNLSGAAQIHSLSISDQPANSVVYSVSPPMVTVPSGATANVTVTMVAAQGAAAGGNQAFLEVNAGGGKIAHATLFTLVK